MLNETEATIKRQYTTCVCGLVVSNSLPPHGLQPARLPCPRNSPGKNTGMGSHLTSPGDLSNPGIKPKFPALQADFLSSEPPGKPTYYITPTMWYSGKGKSMRTIKE